jgi:DNA-binding IclR family transcriptional regulator
MTLTNVKSREAQSLRGLQALEALIEQPQTASEVGRVLDVNRSTALRLLHQLEQAGYVVRDTNSRKFSVRTERFYRLLATRDEHWDMSEIVSPVLAALQERSGEAAVLGVPANGLMVYVSFHPSRHPVAVREAVGTTRPMHASALGKAYLASLETEACDREVGMLSYEGGTELAPKNARDIRAALQEIRERGFAVDRNETFDGVSCVAAAARLNGPLIGAVGISGPSSRLSPEVTEVLGELLVRELGIRELRS